ncbi:MAG: type II secretion system protein [Bacillota bacterium]
MPGNGVKRQRAEDCSQRRRQQASITGHLRDLRGFTLIEVLIALMLIGVLLIPAMSSIATLIANKVRGESRAEALELARSAIEAVKALDAGSFAAGRTVVTVTGPSGRASYDVERLLAVRDEDPSNPANRLWEVTVSVYEHPMQDDALSLCSLTTFIRGE